MKISLFYRTLSAKAYIVFFLFFVLLVGVPSMAHASFFSIFSNVFTGGRHAQAATANIITLADGVIDNSQTVPILKSSINPDIKNTKSDLQVPIIGNDAISPNDNMIGYGIENKPRNITNYIVKKGDTLSGIAQDFDISVNTIRWANNISGQRIKIGEKLKILPVTGVEHIVRKGDTLSGIAYMYDANLNDVMVFNGISKDDPIKPREVIYVPNGVIRDGISSRTKVKSSKLNYYGKYGSSQKAPRGYFIMPVNGHITSPYGPRRGGFHYGIDIGARVGTSVHAAASGKVVTVINYCRVGRVRCGGGYGNFIIIKHPNGMMTRYAHLSKVIVHVGQYVKQRQLIARTGNTGHTTGPHLHFEEENKYGSKLKPVF